MTSGFDHFLSAFFLLGLLIVAAVAWQRFNQPTFPNEVALPRAVEPLRYLFLKGTYGRALLTYVGASLLLYALLVLPGREIMPLLAGKNYPVEPWALVVALVLVGLLPNSNITWINKIEEALRRVVHQWFLVPDGIVRTIGVLEDARYLPPPKHLAALAPNKRKRLQADLKLPSHSLRYRWARASMLIASLQQMGAGNDYPLRPSDFAPFREDFTQIQDTHHQLAKQMMVHNGATKETDDEKLTRSVEALLKRIYAYISWGIRQQARSEEQVDRTLEKLGFQIPVIVPRRLFDIVLPAVLLVAAITAVFWAGVFAVDYAIEVDKPGDTVVVKVLSFVVGASLMYGFIVFIALKQRSIGIEQKSWREGSPRSLFSIAWRAGMATWLLLVLTSLLWRLPETWASIAGIAQKVKSLTVGGVADLPDPVGKVLWVTAITLLPWILVGAAAGAVLASRLSGDVRKTDRTSRVRDAVAIGGSIALAVLAARPIEVFLSRSFGENPPGYWWIPIFGLAGFGCGAVIGFWVPQAYKTNLATPFDTGARRTLESLVDSARKSLGETAARDWIFRSHDEYGGITPAEAIQCKTLQTGVEELLEREARLIRARRDGPVPGSPGDGDAGRAAAPPNEPETPVTEKNARVSTLRIVDSQPRRGSQVDAGAANRRKEHA
jgi:hypothetical protein